MGTAAAAAEAALSVRGRNNTSSVASA